MTLRKGTTKLFPYKETILLCDLAMCEYCAEYIVNFDLNIKKDKLYLCGRHFRQFDSVRGGLLSFAKLKEKL